MGKAKAKGIMTQHAKRYHQDREIIPCKFVKQGGGSGIMVAQYKDTRDLVIDTQGKPIPWSTA